MPLDFDKIIHSKIILKTNGEDVITRYKIKRLKSSQFFGIEEYLVEYYFKINRWNLIVGLKQKKTVTTEKGDIRVR